MMVGRLYFSFLTCSVIRTDEEEDGRAESTQIWDLGFVLTAEGQLDPNANKWNELGLEDFLAQK